MDQVNFQHESLANGRWAEMSFAEQMGNVGSEISRAIHWQSKNKPERMEQCVYRALELISLTISTCGQNQTKLKELCRAKEEICDYFLSDNAFCSAPEQILRYYYSFALTAQKQNKLSNTIH